MRFSVPSGIGYYIGAPAHPIDPEITRAIVNLIRSFPGVQEAHLPQCWAPPMMEEAAQVLVIVVERHVQCSGVAPKIGEGVVRMLPTGAQIDVWCLTQGDPTLGGVRAACCMIFDRQLPLEGQPSARDSRAFGVERKGLSGFASRLRKIKHYIREKGWTIR